MDGSWPASGVTTEDLWRVWCFFRPLLFVQNWPYVRHLTISGSCAGIRKDCTS